MLSHVSLLPLLVTVLGAVGTLGLCPLGTRMSVKHRVFPLSYAFNFLLLFRFSGVFPSVNAAIKRRDQALQVH